MQRFLVTILLSVLIWGSIGGMLLRAYVDKVNGLIEGDPIEKPSRKKAFCIMGFLSLINLAGIFFLNIIWHIQKWNVPTVIDQAILCPGMIIASAFLFALVLPATLKKAAVTSAFCNLAFLGGAVLMYVVRHLQALIH
ncbi:hypothetical protein [Gimesia panareensis]|uniref:Uncharacterized protein n=1 Tax=Gimesia panareensis TaxID=2527978 RepID=A0A518ACE7_9PLAN|nr:hypothetical protein [Gimesia panareensis]QDT29321.1 hypothetical protein Enr10x_46730 [Gimesia panareensis]QDU52364.1 hypothetical protein Pan110_47410 [Gimesia panareensis]